MKKRSEGLKLDDRWEDVVHIVVQKPLDDVPVFTVQPRDGKGRVRTLHKNNLLPLPISLREDPLPQRTRRRPPTQPISQARQSPISEADDNEENDGSDMSDSSDDFVYRRVQRRRKSARAPASLTLPDEVRQSGSPNTATSCTPPTTRCTPTSSAARTGTSFNSPRVPTTVLDPSPVIRSPPVTVSKDERVDGQPPFPHRSPPRDDLPRGSSPRIEPTLDDETPPPRRSERTRRQPDRFVPGQCRCLFELNKLFLDKHLA